MTIIHCKYFKPKPVFLEIFAKRYSSLNSSFASYFAFELTFVAFEDCYYFHSLTLLPFTIEALPSATAASPLDLAIIVVVMQVVNSLYTSIVCSYLQLVAKLKAC